MGEFFTTIFSSFLNKSKGSTVSAYTIIILMFVLLWSIDHYSIISRIDTYFTTGNMMRIAEAKVLYKDNPEAMEALDVMLKNEIHHQTISNQYLQIFSLSQNQYNGRIWLYNTLTSAGVYVLLFIPMTFYTGIKDYLKGQTEFVIELLSTFTVLICILAGIWFLQWVTNQIPPIFGCNTYNYMLNVLIQVAALFITLKPVSVKQIEN